MVCSIVSAFYPIKSKFSEQKYIEWGKTFLKLEAPIILFTEEQLIPKMLELRENRPIKIITIPFNELDAWVLYKELWIKHYDVDAEKGIHTPELYSIWAQKPFFVEKAIKENPFKTDYFFWCDFGAFRNPNINPDILKSFPNTRFLPKNKILLQSINRLDSKDIIIGTDLIYGEYNINKKLDDRLVGGLWGGGIDGCLEWKKAYQKMLEKYFNSSLRFAGKDQTVMLSTYLDNPNLAIVVSCTIIGIDPWFYLEYLLSSMNIPLCIDRTYIRK